MEFKAVEMDEITQAMSEERKEEVKLNATESTFKKEAVSSLCVGARDHRPEDLTKWPGETWKAAFLIP